MTDRRRGNSLDGRTWTRYSISVWDDIRKSKEELRLKHPRSSPPTSRRLVSASPPEGAWYSIPLRPRLHHPRRPPTRPPRHRHRHPA
jgi:hypothetical protein